MGLGKGGDVGFVVVEREDAARERVLALSYAPISELPKMRELADHRPGVEADREGQSFLVAVSHDISVREMRADACDFERCAVSPLRQICHTQ